MSTSYSKSTISWLNYFDDRGIHHDLIESYISYIEKLLSKKNPVVFENEHLSQLVGIKYAELNKMIHSSGSYYRKFKIPKRRGGLRTICAPYPSLIKCQRWIYENILLNKKIHYCAHAYTNKKSIITNAKPHINNRALLKLDIKDFFPSIPINWVINFFQKEGYSNNVSLALASLCCLNNGLPQGAVTSPALSNILLYQLDNRLYKISKSFGLIYTRYADDMVFSGSYIPHKFIGVVTDIISDYGMSVNDEKSKLIIGEKQKIVTGISVQHDKLALPRKKKREIKQELYYIKKYGFISHISKNKIRNPYYLESLIGKLNFWLQIEPDNSFVKDSIDYLRRINL